MAINPLSPLSLTNPFKVPFFPFSLPSHKTHKSPNKQLTIMATKKNATTASNTSTSFYELLSLTSNEVGNEEIKRAYRSMALKYHPDVTHDPHDAEMFVLLNEAYKTLSDPVLRKEYDHKMCLNDSRHVYEDEICSRDLRGRWEEQILELKLRSNFHNVKEEGSWGSRLRARNTNKINGAE